MDFEIDTSTAFILGNGPSLRTIPLERLTSVASFGMNAAYRHWKRIDWRPTHYACLDEVLGLSHKEAIADLIEEGRIEKFLLRQNLVAALGSIGANPKVVNFDKVRPCTPLLQTPSVTTGSSAACWAASLGFEKLIIAGVDLNYVEIVDGAKRLPGVALEIDEATHNPNYFFDDYQQPGDRYNIPNTRPDLHLNAWREVAWYLSQARCEAVNASLHSRVECFAYIDPESLFSERARTSPAKETLREYTVSALAKRLYHSEADAAQLSNELAELRSDLMRRDQTWVGKLKRLLTKMTSRSTSP
ncbi:hypothetical protein [uncultured Erythrobacter sp.]|uniref:hypothetical protein n=1 Tax=uncultured Erythrobacter sp. TaxID=263913 RepID=UPI00260D4FF7|nr:hypothetical protein [uncultured Erythrobacter sp.]